MQLVLYSIRRVMLKDCFNSILEDFCMSAWLFSKKAFDYFKKISLEHEFSLELIVFFFSFEGVKMVNANYELLMVRI